MKKQYIKPIIEVTTLNIDTFLQPVSGLDGVNTSTTPYTGGKVDSKGRGDYGSDAEFGDLW